MAWQNQNETEEKAGFSGTAEGGGQVECHVEDSAVKIQVEGQIQERYQEIRAFFELYVVKPSLNLFLKTFIGLKKQINVPGQPALGGPA